MTHVTLIFLLEWLEFLSAPCLAERKLNDSSQIQFLLYSHVITLHSAKLYVLYLFIVVGPFESLLNNTAPS